MKNERSMKLFADDSEESNNARLVLNEGGIVYEEIPSNGRHVPAFVIGRSWFSTLNGVKDIVATLKNID